MKKTCGTTEWGRGSDGLTLNPNSLHIEYFIYIYIYIIMHIYIYIYIYLLYS